MNYRQPFQPAVDYVEEHPEQTPTWNGQAWVYGSGAPAPEPVEPEPIPLTPFQRKVITGLNALGAEMVGVKTELAGLVRRIEPLERDARWKATAVKALKLLGPAAVGAVAARFPQLAAAIAPVLEAIGQP